MAVKKWAWSLFLCVTFIITLIAIALNKSSKQRVLFTAEELALYNGTDEGLPILLGILGSVFDVTREKSCYGLGESLNYYAGRDASPAFAFKNFTGNGLTDSLRSLSTIEVKIVVDWRDFFFNMHKYVGKLAGRYYDNQGNPTKYLNKAEFKAVRAAQLLKKQEEEEAKQPGCNSRWTPSKEFWCENGYPRLVQRPLEIALTGRMSKRCVCIKQDQLKLSGLEVYEGCDYLSKVCRVLRQIHGSNSAV